MNTKVKVGIAGAIVAALIALIVLDQKTATPPPGGSPPPSAGNTGQDLLISSPAPAGPDTLRASRQGEIDNLLRRVNDNLRSDPAAPPSPAPVTPPLAPVPPPVTPSAPRSDEYVIQSGDTLETIAQAKYGARSFQTLILEANPGLNPNALRIGKKLTLPARAEKKTEETASKDLTVPAPDVVGAKTYVVQPGDTLSGISTKVYKTARYVDKIIQANPDKLSDPHLLVVGAKLTMPELAVRNATAAPSAQVPTSAPAVAGKNHVVQSGDSLWRVAEKYAADKGLGILEMMQELIKANPDKLKDEKTLLRLGWQLVVPE